MTDYSKVLREKGFSSDKLVLLMNKYAADRSEANWGELTAELFLEHVCLLVPALDPEGLNTWLATGRDTDFKFAVFEKDGKKVVAAFVDEISMSKWNPRGHKFVGLRTKALMEIIDKQLDVSMLIVNPNNHNAFSLEKSTSGGMKAGKAMTGDKVRVWAPEKPPMFELSEDLRALFSGQDAVEEAFVYMKEVNNERSLTLGVYFNTTDAGIIKGAMQALAAYLGKSNYLEGVEYIDMQVLENPGSYQWMKDLQQCRVYQKMA